MSDLIKHPLLCIILVASCTGKKSDDTLSEDETSVTPVESELETRDLGITFAINNGDAATNSRLVTLTLSDESNIEQYRAANGDDCSNATYASFQAPISFTLTSENGQKTICMQLINSENIQSETMTDTIELDDIGPIISLAGMPQDPSTSGSVNVNVSGPLAVSYQYGYETGWFCDSITWSDPTSISDPIADSRALDSHHNLCVRGVDENGAIGPIVSHQWTAFTSLPVPGSRDILSFATAETVPGRAKYDFGDHGGVYDGAEVDNYNVFGVGYLRVSGVNHAAIYKFRPDGSLDPDFDGPLNALNYPGNGVVVPYIGDSTNYSRFHKMAVDQNGKLVTAGYWRGGGGEWEWIAMRLERDGTIDTSFATGGLFKIIPRVPNNSAANSVAINSSGKIAICGDIGNADLGIIQLNSDGSLDTDFDGDNPMPGSLSYPGNGVITSELTGTNSERIHDCKFDSSDRLVAVGHVDFSGVNTDTQMAIARFNADGSLDTTFNGTGYNLLNPSVEEDYFHGLAIQSDGKIVAVGSKDTRDTRDEIAFARFLPTGALDTTDFANPDGFYITDLSVSNELLHDVIMDETTGDIIAVGQTNVNALIVRLTTSGAPKLDWDGLVSDPNQPGDGFIEIDDEGLFGNLRAVIPYSGGRLFMLGMTENVYTLPMVIRVWK